MLVIDGSKEKKKYRLLEDNIFEIRTGRIKKKFSKKETFPFGEIGIKSFFETQILNRFRDDSSKFCISTCIDKDPIYLFDLKSSSSTKEYLALMNNPTLIGLEYPNIGISIVYEKILAFSIKLDWYIYFDRYNDDITISWNNPLIGNVPDSVPERNLP